MDYEIVDKPDIIRGQWPRLFNSLPENKAVLFRYSDKETATKQARNIKTTMRSNREVDYSIHFRIVPDGDEFLLYVWKE